MVETHKINTMQKRYIYFII